jgi:hypothetical protein
MLSTDNALSSGLRAAKTDPAFAATSLHGVGACRTGYLSKKSSASAACAAAGAVEWVAVMSKETRDKWMQQVKEKEYSTTRMDDYFDVGESQPRAPKEKAATLARASKKSIKTTTMFKRLRNGEQRDGEMAENDEVVEIETGSNDTTQNQTQVAQRGTAMSNALPHNIR